MAKAPTLAPDLEAGLRRLKLAAMRLVAPELLVTAKTQRWTPEEFLRTLVDAEITSRDESMTATRLKAATFPVIKTFDEFDVTASSIPAGTIDYLASPHRPRRHRQVPRPGRLRRRRRQRRVQGPLPHRRRPRRHPLPRTGRQLRRQGHRHPPATRRDHLRRDGFAPLDDTGAQLLFRFIAAAYERRSIALASHWAFDQWGRFLPEHTTAVSMLDRLLHHASVVITDGESHRMRQARSRTGAAPRRT